MIKKVFAGCAVWGAASAGLLISKSGSSNDIVFGNYSDYISPDVAEELKDKYGLRIDLFDYDHLVKERFEKGIYDMAIVSTSILSELKSTGAAMQLDWSQLLDNEANTSGNEKKTSKDAEELFTDIVKYMSKDLLDYGIPYFVQKLGFYYRGDKIEGLNGPVTFKNLVEKISEEERFISKDGKPTLGLIDDPRTVLSFARKVKGEEDVNPSSDEYESSSAILEDYKQLITKGLNKDKLGNNFLFMHSDSGPLVDALSSKTIQGAFMYNGDGLFGSEGGNGEEDVGKDDFHYVELSENIFFLDFLAFSSNMAESKKENAYKLAKELLFIKKENKDKPFKAKNSKNGEQSCGQDDPKYEEMAVRNFNDVMYTPTLKSIYSNLKSCYFKEGSDDDEGQEEGQEEDTDSEFESVSGDTKWAIIQLEKSENHAIEKEFEKQLDPKKKSDMLIAYSEFKSLL